MSDNVIEERRSQSWNSSIYCRRTEAKINPDISVPVPNNSTYGAHLQFHGFSGCETLITAEELDEDVILDSYLGRRSG